MVSADFNEPLFILFFSYGQAISKFCTLFIGLWFDQVGHRIVHFLHDLRRIDFVIGGGMSIYYGVYFMGSLQQES